MTNNKQPKKRSLNITFIYIGILTLIPLGIFTRGFGLDTIILTFWLIAILLKRGKEFIKDWFIFIILFWVYETLRGWADNIAKILHRPLIITQTIQADKFLFYWLTKGQNLNFWLQQQLPPQTTNHIFLIFLFFFYTMFFWFWAGTGFLLWLNNKKLFKEYMKKLLTLSFLSVTIYTLFPTAPPWYASMKGFLPHLDRIMWSNVFPKSGISYIHFWDQNYFAALPSLHFSWPLLASIFLIKYAKTLKENKLAKYLLYSTIMVPLIILFAIVYGAEHYVIDAIAGLFLIFIVLLF